jgi:Dihydrouridine synthase (Dus)
VKEAVSVPVFANGNILYYSDILACLAATGADAVMSAEGNLYNPAIFLPSTLLPPLGDLPLDNLSEDFVDPQILLTSEHLPHADLTLEYLSIVRSLKTPTGYSAMKGHMFKLMRPALNREVDLRDRLARPPQKGDDVLEYLEAIAKDMKARMDVRATSSGLFLLDGLNLTLPREMQKWLKGHQKEKYAWTRRPDSRLSRIGLCNLISDRRPLPRLRNRNERLKPLLPCQHPYPRRVICRAPLSQYLSFHHLLIQSPAIVHCFYVPEF